MEVLGCPCLVLVVQGWAGYQLPEQWLEAWGSRLWAYLPIHSVEMGVLGLSGKVANNLQSPFHSIAVRRRFFLIDERLMSDRQGVRVGCAYGTSAPRSTQTAGTHGANDTATGSSREVFWGRRGMVRNNARRKLRRGRECSCDAISF